MYQIELTEKEIRADIVAMVEKKYGMTATGNDLLLDRELDGSWCIRAIVKVKPKEVNPYTMKNEY